LLEHGLVVDALTLEEMELQERRKGDKGDKEGANGATAGLLDSSAMIAKIDAFVADALRRAAASPGTTEEKPTTHSHDLRRRTIAAFFKRMPLKKCENCSCHAASLKREGLGKIFKSKLSAKLQHANDELGARTSAAHLFSDGKRAIAKKGIKADADADDDEAEEAGDSLADDVFGVGGADKGEEEEEADAEEAEDDAEVTASSARSAPTGGRGICGSGMTGGWCAVQEVHSTGIALFTVVLRAGPERDYVTVIEAQEHLRRLWESERPILNLIFGTLRRGPNGVLRRPKLAMPISLGADYGGAAMFF